VIVAASKDAIARMGSGRTHAVINSTLAPTAAFVKNPDWQYPDASAADNIRKACGDEAVAAVEAGKIATTLMGDAIATNMFMLGYAFQRGWVPLSEQALLKAIELNGVSVDFNQQSFAWGRLAADNLEAVEKEMKALAPAQVIEFKRAPTLDETIKRRTSFLTDYQNAAYADSYQQFVEQVRAAESKLVSAGQSLRLTEAVARYLFKLMAYKDEYEVARLHSDPAFKKKIEGMFEGNYSIKYHLAPPLLSDRDANGHLIKRQFGSWVGMVFPLLAKLRFLRGSVLDPFGHTEERKNERALILDYRNTISNLLPTLSSENLSQMVELASIPEDIRGYGHVKERHLKNAKQKEAKLLDALKPTTKSVPDSGRHAA
jgi:indolepyruvate ferredoxin oxidoreductase